MWFSCMCALLEAGPRGAAHHKNVKMHGFIIARSGVMKCSNQGHDRTCRSIKNSQV